MPGNLPASRSRCFWTMRLIRARISASWSFPRSYALLFIAYGMLSTAGCTRPGSTVANLPRTDPREMPPARSKQLTRTTPDEVKPDWVARGEQAIQKGTQAEAERLARDAVAAHPRDPRAYTLLGIAFLRGRNVEKARATFERAIAVAPRAAGPQLNLARLELTRGNLERAKKHALRVTELVPDAADGWLLLGRTAQGMGDDARAAKAWRQVIRLEPSQVEPHIRLGMQELDLGHSGQAVAHLKEAYRLGTRDQSVLCALALAEMTNAPDDTATERAVNLVKEAGNPAIPPRWFVDGLIAWRRNDLSSARASFERVLQRDPINERALYSLSQLYRLQGDRARAIQTERRHHTLLAARQRWNLLRLRIESEGPKPALLCDFANALLDGGRPLEAQRAFQQCLQRAPEYPGARRGLERARAVIDSRSSAAGASTP